MTSTDPNSEPVAPPLANVPHLPYELADEIGYRCRIGLIVLSSDRTIEYEFRKMLDIPGVAVHHSRIPNDERITPETLAAMKSRITEGTRVILPEDQLDVVAFGCTSGAMVIGPENVHACIHAARPGVACTSPLEAAVAGFRALGSKRICLITPYVDELTRGMRAYIVDQDLQVPIVGSWNLSDDSKIARITSLTSSTAVMELARSDDVDAVFVACTSLRLAAAVDGLERAIGKPVLSSNTATAWHCLRLAGCDDDVPGFGALFQTPLSPTR